MVLFLKMYLDIIMHKNINVKMYSAILKQYATVVKMFSNILQQYDTKEQISADIESAVLRKFRCFMTTY